MARNIKQLLAAPYIKAIRRAGVYIDAYDFEKILQDADYGFARYPRTTPAMWKAIQVKHELDRIELYKRLRTYRKKRQALENAKLDYEHHPRDLCNCGAPADIQRSPCPYQWEINGVDDSCDCCPECRYQCAQDI